MSGTDIYDTEKIEKIITLYKKSKARDKAKYEKKKADPDFVSSNRARAKAHYEANKEVKATEYKNNKEYLKNKSLFNYYRSNDRIDEFREKYPEKCECLINHGVVVSTGGIIGSA
tara:strand:+ start:445 stop:789 length:345 start_codon:yes stop_codon:yes gene_type:complete